jgi:vacuolar-type H+-ATPase subunit H
LSQETIAQILAIEQRAVQIHDDAQRQAAQVLAEAEKAAAVSREQALAKARQQAEQIVAAGREVAGAERARIVAQAEAEAEQMESVAAQRFDRAAQFVLDQVAGRQ